MKTLRTACCTLLLILAASVAAFAQDTGTFTGTVHDSTGAVVSGAEVTITNTSIGVSRTETSNADGDWLAAGLPIGSYDLSVTAKGFKKYEAKGVVLRVAQKARVDVNLEVGSITTEVKVAGENVAQVETQSSEISGVVTAAEISQLELNGRNFTQLVTLTPGVSNQTNQDEGTVGVNGNVQYSVNGGRVEYNNWEIDGGDNMDNGSNTSLNVYPSVDAIQEVKVLTSNYGAEYGRNASGTIETETKSGTTAFHGDAYEFVRNDDFNARPYFNTVNPPYKKNDFGYTIGGPIYIPNHYNSDKSKTFFFWSQEWRRERQPTQFNQAVPSVAERGGNFSDLCALSPAVSCPSGPGIVNNQVTTIDPNGAALLAMIPAPNSTTGCGSPTNSCFVESFSQPTTWREELIRVDHNLNSKNRLTFRYIHDSWQTVTPVTLWGDLTSTFPTINTNFVGPGTSFVAKITTTASPTLLNEFVFSYTADHINLTNTGTNWVRPTNSTQTGLFDNGFGGKLSGIDLINDPAYGGGFMEDPAYIPWVNANPTYTFRDNVTKILGNHNVQFGAYAVAAQKNEVNSNIGSVTGDVQGILTFDASNSAVSSGNAFADLLLGNIATYQQDNKQLKYYNRYKILEPYVQDDWHVTSRLTLNLGLRISLFGTYYEKYKNAYNWDEDAYNPANAPAIDPNTGALVDPNTGLPLSINDPRIYNGIIQCGAPGVPRGCMKGHLFNPAPRIGFAWDPRGDGKTSIRAGYGIFFEHTNGNEGNTESLEGSPPLVLSPSQSNITGATCAGPSGYECIGAGGGLLFPLNVTSIPNKVTWPYSQQYSLSVERQLFKDTVASFAYVGSKGTHLTLQQDINQIFPTPANANPYTAGVPMTSSDCSNGVANGVPVATLPQSVQNNFNTACGNVTTVDPFRPHLGFGNIQFLGMEANSSYNSFQTTLRRTVGPIVLNVAYTYSHSIDDFSDRSDSTFVNSYDLRANRASSNFDQRHLLSVSYVYELPNFHSTGWKRTVLGNWEWTGITTFSTGTPFTVVNNIFSDNAGVANGASGGSYPDLVGNPRAPISAADQALGAGPQIGPLLYNPAAFAAPTGLTFGDAGRNSLNNPSRLNFDMGLFKNFPIHEAIAMEFRAEAFNVFNHTEFYLYNDANGNSASNQFVCTAVNGGDPSCLTNSTFLRPAGAHNNRILQLGLKLYF